MTYKYSVLLICLSLVACERSQTNKIQNIDGSEESPINLSIVEKSEAERKVDILTFNQSGFADILVNDGYTDKNFKEIEDSRIEECFYAKSLKYPKLDIDFQIIDQKIAVISTQNSDYKVDNGLKVGDSEQKIYQIYGNRKFEKILNPYGDFKNQYSIFYWKDKTKTFGIRYDIDNHKVTEIYVGNQNLELMEGCA